MTDPYRKLTRSEASDGVTRRGWRLVLGELRSEVRTGSLVLAADVAGRAATVAGAEGHLRLDVRTDRVLLALQTAAVASVTERDVELAHAISTVVDEMRLETVSGVGEDGAGTDGAGTDGAGTAGGAGLDGDIDGDGSGGLGRRSVQVLEIGIDALDASAIRPFWRAVLGYVDEPGWSGPWDGLVDPLGQGPAVWFQRMDAPRPQRNRIHFDVSVPHDEAAPRIRATLAAGGKLLSDAEAPAFWVLADAEGNEACVSTWQGRDG
ncbi:MAG TPA: VOC family protein [Streptosporangiaceae bacterium]|nr:VOC family protein [Streptosporangiaceae bacterium]